MSEEPKKDLTSIVELSALEMQKNGGAGHAHGGDLEMPVIEKITDADFGDLESMSKEAHAAAAHDAVPDGAAAEQLAPPAAEPAAPALEAVPTLEAGPALEGVPEPGVPSIVMNESAPGEAPNIPTDGTLGLPPLVDSSAPAPTTDFSLPSFSQIGTGDSQPAEGTVTAASLPPTADAAPELAPELAPDAPVIAINEGFPSDPQLPPPDFGSQTLPEPTSTVTTPGLSAALSEPQTRPEMSGGPAPPPEAKSKLDPDRQPVRSPPAGSEHAVKGGRPGADKPLDLAELKAFADKMSIGKPRLEGAPAFSLLVRSENGHFDEKTVKAIEDAVTSEDFGIRLEDVAIQLTAGKLLVPQISEFAAVTLAQKLRDVVDNIEVDLANEIFKSVSIDHTAEDPMLLDTEEFESHREEVHDIGAEPRSADDLFSTNLTEVREFQVTRILSVVMTTELIAADIAENPTSKEFEQTVERLTEDLITRAYKLGAHGVLGVSFALKAVDAFRDHEGKIKRAYRLMGNGTAVRVRRRSAPDAEPQAT